MLPQEKQLQKCDRPSAPSSFPRPNAAAERPQFFLRALARAQTFVEGGVGCSGDTTAASCVWCKYICGACVLEDFWSTRRKMICRGRRREKCDETSGKEKTFSLLKSVTITHPRKWSGKGSGRPKNHMEGKGKETVSNPVVSGGKEGILIPNSLCCCWK